jgi:DNA-binding NarL/FixJ family response regulator
MPISLLIIDDHEMVRHGLVSIFKDSGIEIVGQGVDGHEAVKLARKLRPDVVLLDVRMGGRDGIESIAPIRAASDKSRIVMLSAFDSPATTARAVSAGAHDFILKSATRSELIEAVTGAAAGAPPTRAGDFRRIAGTLAAGKPAKTPDNPLTPRETQVLRLVATGLSNQEIGDSLDISVETVKEHVQNLLRKLGLGDRTQAAVWAVRQKMV